MIRLQKGATLIEASAGTGKTYTLCRIALQLTLEKGIPLDRILAVTFTEAATEELAARIRQLYEECLRQIETGEIEEALLRELMDRDGFDAAASTRLLRYSLEVFDEVPISTIHGFCKRSLEQVALETRSPIDAELKPVESELIVQLQTEYIRQSILESSTALSAAFANQSGFAEKLAEIGRQAFTRPYARIRPEARDVSTAELDRMFGDLPGQLHKLLDEAPDCLPHLKSNMRIAKILARADSPLRAAARRGSLLPEDLSWLGEFHRDKWDKSVKKSGACMAVPAFVDTVSTFLVQLRDAFDALAARYRPWLAERLRAAKERANVITFNDLLHSLNRALQADDSGRVAQLIASRYDAALIDEFQDTDRVQFQIAHQLFGDGTKYLFFIGDPKQSIYRFRGADIYAYFEATRDGGLPQITLGENFRSAPGLVRAVNELFEFSRAKFADDRIAFRPVTPARDDLVAPFDSPAPFTIRHFATTGAQAPASASDYRRALADLAADDFARRLNSDTAFKADGATFLVNNRYEAEALNDALLRRGIAAAIRAERSIFATSEADDLKQLLAALANPSRTSLKRGALALLDRRLDAARIAADGFEDLAAPAIEFLADWARAWFELNVDVAFRRFVQLLDGLSPPVNDPDAERRHANLAQLAELLSEARDSEGLSPRGLLNWLSRSAELDASQEEAWQTRISSDDGKPQIVTIHKSKGLQFPVVVLPFLGLLRAKSDESYAIYHESGSNVVIDFDPASNRDGYERAQREALAEQIRLIYVALTRAVYENVVYLCPEELRSRGLAGSSFARFLLGKDDATTAEVATALESLAQASDGAIRYEQVAHEEGPRVRLQREPDRSPGLVRERALSRPIGPAARVLSFSALSRSLRLDEAAALAHSESDNDDADGEPARDETVEEPSDALSIFTLPKGTRAGDLLHLILERYDFSQPDMLAETTREAFRALQFEPREYEPIVAAQIQAIGQATLHSKYGTFRLKDIDPGARIAELEFAYPTDGDVRASLAAAFRDAPLGTIPEAWTRRFESKSAPVSASMLRGFIDLVFEREGRLYIVDWKSNYLGARPSSYSDSAMRAAMAEHDYFLQYCLYAVAAKRFLAWRFPQDDFAERFGGVFYVFARGVAPGKDTGIYYDLPPVELLDALDQALGGRRATPIIARDDEFRLEYS